MPLQLRDLFPHWDVSGGLIPTPNPARSPAADIAYLRWLRGHCVLFGAPSALDELIKKFGVRRVTGVPEPILRAVAVPRDVLPLDLDSWELEAVKRMTVRAAVEPEVGVVLGEAISEALAVAIVDPYFFSPNQRVARAVLLNTLPARAPLMCVGVYNAGKGMGKRSTVQAALQFVKDAGERPLRVGLVNKEEHPIHDRVFGIVGATASPRPPGVQPKGYPELFEPHRALVTGTGIRALAPPPLAHPPLVAVGVLEPARFRSYWRSLWAPSATAVARQRRGERWASLGGDSRIVELTPRPMKDDAQ